MGVGGGEKRDGRETRRREEERESMRLSICCFQRVCVYVCFVWWSLIRPSVSPSSLPVLSPCVYLSVCVISGEEDRSEEESREGRTGPR